MWPFRFSACPPDGVLDAAQIASTARRAEAIGYSAIVYADHLTPQHSPIPLLATIAAVTERLRIGTYVLNAALRHPAVLAQELASLDVLSGGRLEIGLGAGWNRPEHDAVGLPFPPIGERVARLDEVITVLRGCFGAGEFSFAGGHVTISGHDGHPKPVQQPHPPFFLGGGGRRLLTLAARQADIIGLAPRLPPGPDGRPALDPHSITAAATEEKLGWIRAAAGERFDRLELNTYPAYGPVVVTNSARAEADRRATELRQRTGVELSADEILDSPHVLIGTIDQLAAKLVETRERFGISSYMLDGVDELAPLVERLAGR